MNNLVLERIKNQQIKITPRVKPNTFVKLKKKELSKPLEINELKNLLMSELEKKEIVEEIKNEPLKEKIFENIIQFVDWYIPNRQNFNEFQQKAIDTLVTAREMIEKGCGCQRHNRINRAEDYFKNFWEKNSKTDMIQKVNEILQVQNIKFKSRDVIFLDLNM